MSERLGIVIRARRLELSLSQAELAAELGLSRSRISAIETGHIGQLRLLEEVCTALGLEVLALPRETREASAAIHSQQRLLRAVDRQATSSVQLSRVSRRRGGPDADPPSARDSRPDQFRG